MQCSRQTCSSVIFHFHYHYKRLFRLTHYNGRPSILLKVLGLDSTSLLRFSLLTKVSHSDRTHRYVLVPVTVPVSANYKFMLLYGIYADLARNHGNDRPQQ